MVSGTRARIRHGNFQQRCSHRQHCRAPTDRFLQIRFGWQTAFLVTGGLGFVWLVLWLMFYETPERHASLSHEEYAHIKQGRETDTDSDRSSWRRLLKYRQVWAIVLARFVTDPVWWLYITWLPLYL